MGRLLLIAGLVALAASAAGAAPQRTAHDCVRGGELFFNAADGTKLVGHRFGRGTTAVILTHQSEGDLCDWLPYAKRLAGKGYFAFPIDFRGYGFSDTPPSGQFRYVQDIDAAAKVLRKLGKRKIFGVVSVSSPARYRGLDGVKAAGRLRVPVLYLAATGDDNAGFDFSKDAEAMFAKTAATDKRLELLPGTAHGIGLVASSARTKTLVERFLAGR